MKKFVVYIYDDVPYLDYKVVDWYGSEDNTGMDIKQYYINNKDKMILVKETRLYDESEYDKALVCYNELCKKCENDIKSEIKNYEDKLNIIQEKLKD